MCNGSSPDERQHRHEVPPKVRFADIKHIPGRRGLPIVGILPEALLDPLAFGLAMRDRYGPIHRFYASGNWCVQLLSAEANELVLADRDGVFSSYYGWKPVLGPYFGGGLLLMDFDEHRIDRRLIGAAFRTSALPSAIAAFADLVEQRLPSWAEGPTEWHSEASALLRDNASMAFMGLPPGRLATEMGRAFDQLRQCTTAVLPACVPHSKAARATSARDQILNRLTDEVLTRRGSDAPDLLTRLSNLRDIDQNYCTPEFVARHMIFVLAAAHDTMVAAVCSTAWQLARHPEMQEIIATELARDDGEPEPAISDVGRQAFTDAFIRECIRLHAPAPILWRRAMSSFRVETHNIPAGTMVAVNPLVTHRNPQFFPDPDRFDPHRFMNPRVDVPRWAYIPFGGGSHTCLGVHYSFALLRTLLLIILSKYRVLTDTDYRPRWGHWPYAHPTNGLPIRLRPI